MEGPEKLDMISGLLHERAKYLRLQREQKGLEKPYDRANVTPYADPSEMTGANMSYEDGPQEQAGMQDEVPLEPGVMEQDQPVT